MRKGLRSVGLVMGGVLLSAVASAAQASVTTFDGEQTNGWGIFYGNDGVLGDFVLPEGGNTGANLQWRMVDTFGFRLRNDTNADVLGNYSRFSSGVTLSVDVKVTSIHYDPFFDGGYEVPRHLVVELVDYGETAQGLPYTSVWYDLGVISSAATSDWTTMSITVDDVLATALPAGWGGYGAETAFGEPFLPTDRTFASVLSSVDEIWFTSYVPGYVYGFTAYDLQFDNITVAPAAIPEPSALALITPAALLLGRRRR